MKVVLETKSLGETIRSKKRFNLEFTNKDYANHTETNITVRGLTEKDASSYKVGETYQVEIKK